MKIKWLVVPSIVALAFVACQDTAKDERNNSDKWFTVQSPLTGLCYEMYAPWNKQMGMVQIDCSLVKDE